MLPQKKKLLPVLKTSFLSMTPSPKAVRLSTCINVYFVSNISKKK